MINRTYIIACLVLLNLFACNGQQPIGKHGDFPETFEGRSKTAYAKGDVQLSSGTWTFDNALLGTSPSDHKKGNASVRIQVRGSITSEFDVTGGAGTVQIEHAVFGTDPAATWQLLYSTDKGASWSQAGSTITTSSQELNTASFQIGVSSAVRFRIKKLTGGRLNIDDFNITKSSGGQEQTTTQGQTATLVRATRDDNMALGNPSGAGASSPDNYLLKKVQYVLSYNNSKGIANWVSWHLSTAWKGSAERCNCFAPDNSLPSGFFKALTSNYTATGFDRGHLCPSDDRDGTDADNAATFLMPNIAPQSPILNQQTWGALEMYCRNLITQGYELYIIAGGYGQGGESSNGETKNAIASGKITVPAHFWKIIVVLPIGTNDISRISPSTRIIAVDMPNQQTVNAHNWDYYRTTVDAIEGNTGYDFLSNVPTNIQAVIESRVDKLAIQ